MVSLGTVFDAHVHVAAGDGRLVRRVGACLYIPAPIDDTAGTLIDHVLDTSDDLVAAVGDFVLEHTDAPPFVLVTWPTTAASDAVHLLVRGNASVETDMASVPALSGVGTTTWAEHRVRRQPDRASIRSGAPAEADTMLTDGVVPAGGFSLDLTAAEPASTPNPQPAPPESGAVPQPAPSPSPSPESGVDATVEPVVAAPAAAVPEPADSAPGGLGLAALRAASGATAPDEPATAPATPTPATPTPAPSAPPPAPATADIPDTPAAPPAKPAHADSVAPTPHGPPQFPGALTDHGDPEVTLAPSDLSDAPLPPVHRLLQAAVCENGHSNPPHRAACRVCDATLSTDQTTTVEQPVLAIAELPSGDTIPIDSIIVLGRNPSAEAARVEADHQLIVLDAPSSVSRTHLVISVDAWTITATDCGSQGGSALVPDGADEPIELTAWVPHELSGGDTLYLGGPTFVRILDVPN